MTSPELLPESPQTWLKEGALEAFPDRNGHNKFYYGFETLFTPAVRAFIEERAVFISKTVKEMDKEKIRVTFPDSRKCVNCGKAFFGKQGRLRWAAIVMPCSGAKMVKADRCVQCKVIQWLMEGAIRGKLREKPQLPPVDRWNHPGYAPCSHCYKLDCRNNWTLADIYKVAIDEAPPEKKKQ